jgi:plasmid stabilization system protein ParE
MHEVRLSPLARRDFSRLAEFLRTKNPSAARRAVAALSRGLRSLQDHPERGREASNGFRELRIRFGRDGYVARYVVDPHAVFVARIFHARERR